MNMLFMYTPDPIRAPFSFNYDVQGGELRKNVPTSTRTMCVDTM